MADQHPSEFVPMPTPTGVQFHCTGDDCRALATSGCRNCGVARCPAHPNEQHVHPCPQGAAAQAMGSIVTVKGCMYCPLNGLAERGQDDSQQICQHPDATPKFREVAPENEQPPTEAPDWCPLRMSALVVQLVPAPTIDEGGQR